jgi:hypothetical protein
MIYDMMKLIVAFRNSVNAPKCQLANLRCVTFFVPCFFYRLQVTDKTEKAFGAVQFHTYVVHIILFYVMCYYLYCGLRISHNRSTQPFSSLLLFLLPTRPANPYRQPFGHCWKCIEFLVSFPRALKLIALRTYTRRDILWHLPCWEKR